MVKWKESYIKRYCQTDMYRNFCAYNLLVKILRRYAKSAWYKKHRIPRWLSGEKSACQRKRCIQPLWRTVWRVLKKLEIDMPYDPAIPLLGIHTEKTRRESAHKAI